MDCGGGTECGVAQPVPRAGQAALPLFAGACGRLVALGRPRRSTLPLWNVHDARRAAAAAVWERRARGGRGAAISISQRSRSCSPCAPRGRKVIAAARAQRKRRCRRHGPQISAAARMPRRAAQVGLGSCREGSWSRARGEVPIGVRAEGADAGAQLGSAQRAGERGGLPADGAAAVPSEGGAARSFDTMLLRCGPAAG